MNWLIRLLGELFARWLPFRAKQNEKARQAKIAEGDNELIARVKRRWLHRNTTGTDTDRRSGDNG